mgnify:CR=1 FL=1
MLVIFVESYGRGALDADLYADTIRAIDWVVANKDAYNIRVINLSFSAEPRSYYWDDPMNQAVMAAWQAGIVVVASAGNTGPNAMTIGAPGNVPYVITVGAMTDNYTPDYLYDDFLASFSSAGPTVEGFVKPDLVAPGGHARGLMHTNVYLAVTYPEFHDGAKYFMMSGTSQATAVVSGIAALLLQDEPWLTPDVVKGRLMSSARPASYSGGSLAYSVLQQGAGLVNAYDAVHSNTSHVANRGLDIDADLAGTAHYGGPVSAWETRTKRKVSYVYYVRDNEGNPLPNGGYEWNGNYVYTDGYLWSDAVQDVDALFRTKNQSLLLMDD